MSLDGLTESGVDYCTEHDGIRNEDEHWCDFRGDDDAHDCPTCNGTGTVEIEGERGHCPDCEEGITLCDLTPLLYEAAS